jgi:phenylacetate-coenzyme A ligase PaaK-like adenylate-forming protein
MGPSFIIKNNRSGLNNLSYTDHFIFDEPDFNISRFKKAALELFLYQYAGNQVYRRFVDTLGVLPGSVREINDIPFLPIRFFKTHRVITGNDPAKITFISSGTSGTGDSTHLVTDPLLYEQSLMAGFQRIYGALEDWCVLALLPSYLERGGSSLVHMADLWIRATGHPDSGFYLHDHERLQQTLMRLESAGQKTLLLGVTYALLDFSERFPGRLEHVVIMETGGMKGRRKEMVRAEVHELLKQPWGIDAVHSEYGMTELLSQAYATKDGFFRCPPWMQILLRSEDDPLERTGYTPEKPLTGLVDIIDLANRNSCAFISTDDIGRLYPDGSFEILGRMDNSDLRGCSLMVV